MRLLLALFALLDSRQLLPQKHVAIFDVSTSLLFSYPFANIETLQTSDILC